MQMFIAALFIIAKTWKQMRCPLVGEWINKLWYIQTMEYYGNEILSHGKHGGNLNACYQVKETNLKRTHTV